jgi:putative FmdB family regulatory protein
VPIFEFQCTECGEQFEFLVLPSSDTPTCPSCASEDLEKVLSLTAMSSDQTRARSLEGAKKRAGKIRYEKEHEEHKKAHKHTH